MSEKSFFAITKSVFFSLVKGGILSLHNKNQRIPEQYNLDQITSKNVFHNTTMLSNIFVRSSSSPAFRQKLVERMVL